VLADVPEAGTIPLRVYEISVQAEFSAAHALMVGGEREPLHGHNWHVTVTVAGPELDSDGLLCDFHVVERALRECVGLFHNRSLNESPPFAGARGINPSAELVARHIADRVAESAAPVLHGRTRLHSVRVTEAPGCAATYFPPDTGASGHSPFEARAAET
jgi:6-pyruvoyltetrahydropterin/6-carboxytetrahydropterin synthase